MMARRFWLAGSLSFAALTLAACQSDAQQDAVVTAAPGLPGQCREDAAETLAGKARIDDAEAQQITGATVVRQIRPGQGVTMDYRRERLTIETDPKTGKIVRAYCG
ncbi:I78 family peptidase inhibitor [uncultured Bosea sp.]|uniref:I78 family peptidase inhibitor n=1 Tax=uncultured Bosea sp. TaxID=211457 RepID=UPI00263B05D3|nr:I78 family peptidase inhibitor [uncultured Bosea sp.]